MDNGFWIAFVRIFGRQLNYNPSFYLFGVQDAIFSIYEVGVLFKKIRCYASYVAVILAFYYQADLF